MPGVELRAGRAPCVLSRRRHAELGGAGRDRRRPRRWLFGLLRLRHGGNRGDFRSTPHRLGRGPAGRLLPGCRGTRQSWPKRGRWTVHRVAVADTARWIEMCGVADLIWLESPSNPLLTVADLDAICAAPRKRGAILGVDNTFATPLNQCPLALGADVAMQSATKFIGGHSDLLSGVVTVRDANLLAALREARELAGATPGTLETFLAVRGARTLALRLERAQCNAMTLAERLARHPNVTLTRYPGLASHPTHAAARRQLKGFGTIISFDVRGGASSADAVCAGVQLIQHATSLGAVESTIERRASIPGQEHLPPALLRLSVGIEAAEDLWTDLDRALRNVAG